jgi:hypothetical protein
MAAGSTYTPIATYTFGTGATSVSFSSIPSTYTDLVIAGAFQFTSAAGAAMYFNTDTPSANTKYSITSLSGSGTAAASGRSANVSVMYINNYSGGTAQMSAVISLNNYSNTTTYKTGIIRANDTSTYVEAGVGLWRDTSAINKITIYGGTFVAGSMFTIYGIAAA